MGVKSLEEINKKLEEIGNKIISDSGNMEEIIYLRGQIKGILWASGELKENKPTND